MDPAEEIITEATTGGSHVAALRRLSCNMAASVKIFCDMCGSALDESTITVYVFRKRTGEESLAGAVCPKCRSAMVDEAMAKYALVRKMRAFALTWNEETALS